MKCKDVSPRSPRDDKILLGNQGDAEWACNLQVHKGNMLNAFSSGSKQREDKEAMESFGPEGVEEEDNQDMFGD